MGRPSKPHFRASRKTWVCTIDGKYHTLAHGRENRGEAYKTFHKLMAGRGKKPARNAGLSLNVLCEAFMDHTERHMAATTYTYYKQHLEKFRAHVGPDYPASEVRPQHVTEWLSSTTWGDTTRAGAISAVKRLFSWARQQRLLPTDELADLQKPTARRREKILTPDQALAILTHEGSRHRNPLNETAWKDLITFLHETGCRPSEAMAVEASMVDLQARTVVMASKTTRRTGRHRVIYLTPLSAEIVSRLGTSRPVGPIFLNTRGRPWTRKSMADRFARLRIKLGIGSEATAESFRHLFVTDALERSVPIATVSELVGHTSTAMVSRHYSRLSDRHAHLSEAARSVRSTEMPVGATIEPGIPGTGSTSGSGGNLRSGNDTGSPVSLDVAPVETDRPTIQTEPTVTELPGGAESVDSSR